MSLVFLRIHSHRRRCRRPRCCRHVKLFYINCGRTRGLLKKLYSCESEDWDAIIVVKQESNVHSGRRPRRRKHQQHTVAIPFTLLFHACFPQRGKSLLRLAKHGVVDPRSPCQDRHDSFPRFVKVSLSFSGKTCGQSFTRKSLISLSHSFPNLFYKKIEKPHQHGRVMEIEDVQVDPLLIKVFPSIPKKQSFSD